MSLGRYTSKFVASDGTKYGVEITYHNLHTLTDSDILEEVTLSADPVRIYYSSESKLDPIVQSRATVELVSPRDGMYHHLYSLLGRDVRLEVYTIETSERWEYPDDADYSGPPVQTIKEVRGATIWIGTIDPESYQEPYTSADGYTVQMSFSDLGALKRQRHRLSGRMSVRSIIQEMLNEAQFRVALQLHSGELQDIEVLGYEPASLHARTSTGIETNGVRVGIFDAGYIDTALFFSSEGEPWPCYRVLEETLRPFRLRLEQRGGVYHINDNNTLSRDIAELTRSRGEDAILMSDRIYNNVALSTDPRLEAARVQADQIQIPKGYVYQPIPRIDIEGYTAYEECVLMLEEDNYQVATKPATTGEAMSAIALYYDPMQTQGVLLKPRYNQYGLQDIHNRPNQFYMVRQRETMDLEVVNIDGDSVLYNNGVSFKEILPPVIPQALSKLGRTVEHYTIQQNRRVFSREHRVHKPVTSLNFNISGGLQRSDHRLILGAEIFVGLGRSLYQSSELDPNEQVRNAAHKVSQAMNLERAELFVAIEAFNAAGRKVANIRRRINDTGVRHTYDWIGANANTSTPTIPLLFGGVDGLKLNAWSKAKPYNYDQVPRSDDYKEVREEHKRWEELWGEEGGMVLPVPYPVFNATSIRVTLYTGVEITFNEDGAINGLFIKHGDEDRPLLYGTLLNMGLLAPNCVLVRNLSVHVARRDGRKPNTDPSTTHAYINADAYEPIEQTLMLSTTPDVEAYSPARLRDKNGKPLGANALIVEGAERTSITGTIAELYATSVASLYGKRGHIIEGTYRIRRAPTVIGYVGRRYMVLREEIDLRDSKSRLTMATFSPDGEKPTFYTPKKKKQ